jgi:hypothetical protein
MENLADDLLDGVAEIAALRACLSDGFTTWQRKGCCRFSSWAIANGRRANRPSVGI